MSLPFFTIGHSNRSFEEFVELLTGAAIGLVADIRRIPRSRANPQFNEDTLPEALAGHGISYERVATLGGLRGKARTVSRDVNGFRENESFHRYADYALSSDFHAGLEHLVEQGRSRRCDDVFGGRMVALPPSHRRRSSHRARRNGFPHHGARAVGARPHQQWRGHSDCRSADVSCRKSSRSVRSDAAAGRQQAGDTPSARCRHAIPR